MDNPAPLFGIDTSAKGQKWIAPNIDAVKIQSLVREGVSDFEARILALRGIDSPQVASILSPKLKTQMPDPFVLLGMENAVSAIIEAVIKRANIVIFADYDVDGGTSAAILMSWFEYVGASASVFVPDRIIDGYGPSPELMRKIKASGADLMISVDCGAAAHDALETAHSIGLEVVVFDHHLMHGEAPKCRALVNPNQASDNSGLGNLTAAGVCFMAATALNRAWRENGNDASGFDAIALLDLVALGTVCDVAPLTGLNRVFVAQGQKVLGQLGRVGLAELALVAGLKRAGNVYAAAWVLGPRLNAGGRIGDASLTVRLLTTTDPDEARKIALQLETLNAERRAIEAGVVEEAVHMVESGLTSDGRPLKEAAIIVIGAQGWHPGIIGIVAGRLKERFNRPCIVIGSIGEGDKIAKGSGRSIDGVNLGALVKGAVDAGILLGGGGHAMAAGLSIEFSRLQEAQDYFSSQIATATQEALNAQSRQIDAIISVASIELPLIEAQERLGPFGTSWPEPLFCIPSAKIQSISIVGNGHMRVQFCDSEDANAHHAGQLTKPISQRAICFGALGTAVGDVLASKRPCHLILRLKRDEWRGGAGVEAEIIDVALA